MGKSKHSKNNDRFADREYMDGYGVTKSTKDNRKEKRIEHLLRTKSIENLVEEEDEGLDPIDYDYLEQLELEDHLAGRTYDADVHLDEYNNK